MKKFTFNAAHKYLLLFTFSVMQLMAFSQDAVTHTSTSVTTKTNDFVIEPWMWIVGGAVLLVILVALLRGSSSKEVSRTTVIKNDSV